MSEIPLGLPGVRKKKSNLERISDGYKMKAAENNLGL